MNILILEDNDERIAIFKQNLIGFNVTITKDSKECIDLLKNNDIYDYIFLDHDLGGLEMVKSGENTGYEVAEWISQNKDKCPNQIFIHSLNMSGATAIQNILKDNSINAERIPFLWNKFKQI